MPDPWYTGDSVETFRLADAGSMTLLKKLDLMIWNDCLKINNRPSELIP
ncbi:hypothetical protein [Neisseria iguanae]|nr:hypothetical protein [Neisseria iguanae]